MKEGISGGGIRTMTSPRVSEARITRTAVSPVRDIGIKPISVHREAAFTNQRMGEQYALGNPLGRIVKEGPRPKRDIPVTPIPVRQPRSEWSYNGMKERYMQAKTVPHIINEGPAGKRDIAVKPVVAKKSEHITIFNEFQKSPPTMFERYLEVKKGMPSIKEKPVSTSGKQKNPQTEIAVKPILQANLKSIQARRNEKGIDGMKENYLKTKQMQFSVKETPTEPIPTIQNEFEKYNQQRHLQAVQTRQKEQKSPQKEKQPVEIQWIHPKPISEEKERIPTLKYSTVRTSPYTVAEQYAGQQLLTHQTDVRGKNDQRKQPFHRHGLTMSPTHVQKPQEARPHIVTVVPQVTKEKNIDVARNGETKFRVEQPQKQYVESRQSALKFVQPVTAEIPVEQQLQSVRAALQKLTATQVEVAQATTNKTVSLQQSEAIQKLNQRIQAVAQETSKPLTKRKKEQAQNVLQRLQEKIQKQQEFQHKLLIRKRKDTKVKPIGFDDAHVVNERRIKYVRDIYLRLSTKRNKGVSGYEIAKEIPMLQNKSLKSLLKPLQVTDMPDGSLIEFKQYLAAVRKFFTVHDVNLKAEELIHTFPAVKVVEDKGRITPKYVEDVVLGDIQDQTKNTGDGTVPSPYINTLKKDREFLQSIS